MIHYVLLKLKNGLTEETKAIFESTYASLTVELDGLKSAEVRYNCVTRDQNMDVMVRMEMRDEAVLKEYIAHPLHVGLVNSTKEIVSTVISFDYLP